MSSLGGAQKYALMMLAPLVGRHEIEVLVRDCAAIDPQRLAAMFDLQLDGVSFAQCRSRGELLRRGRGADLFINASYASLLPNVGRRGIYVVFFPVPIDDQPGQTRHARSRLLVENACQRLMYGVEDIDPSLYARDGLHIGAYRRKFGALRTLSRLPLFALRKLAWIPMRDLRLGAAALASYDRLLAISEFTAHWTSRLYDQECGYLFPPIDTEAFRPAAKHDEIIAVGRFDDGENSKKLHIVIDGFRQIHDSGALRGWALHVCGAVGGAESQAYLQRLREQAQGYPIEFHPNLPFGELVERYGRAKLFWHAMGYGADVERHPWRCEHFGMATAEARSAGCVPMVYRAGGQPEIVGADRTSGYLWTTLAELALAVQDYLALPPAAAWRMSTAARLAASRYSHAEFFAAARRIYREQGISTDHCDADATTQGAASAQRRRNDLVRVAP